MCKAFDLWLACHTQEEIAERLDIAKATVNNWISDSFSFGKLAKNEQSAAEHATDFEPPIYNIWKQQEKTAGASHFGNSEVRWVDNLLYLYTSPFDIVVDPFGGGGSTIDICRKRFRRHWVSDRKPVVERAEDIRKWDLTDGTPPLPRWSVGAGNAGGGQARPAGPQPALLVVADGSRCRLRGLRQPARQPADHPHSRRRRRGRGPTNFRAHEGSARRRQGPWEIAGICAAWSLGWPRGSPTGWSPQGCAACRDGTPPSGAGRQRAGA